MHGRGKWAWFDPRSLILPVDDMHHACLRYNKRVSDNKINEHGTSVVNPGL